MLSCSLFFEGPFLLTNLLLDKLIASAPSRIINVVGLGYHNASIGFTDFNLDLKYDATLAYKRSKLALAMFTNELVKRLEGNLENASSCDHKDSQYCIWFLIVSAYCPEQRRSVVHHKVSQSYNVTV